MDKKIEEIIEWYGSLLPTLKMEMTLKKRLKDLVQQAKEDCIEIMWDNLDGVKTSKITKAEKAIRQE
ncbi:unnamed protein product [marine sediment metagenome]|uniref:Uncharacterized protein n=1 Tax=marine sediment metagenome TaxID=412755 RepID=X1AXX5_9ZZZZ